MSLYQVQNLIYQLNRDPHTRERYAAERDAVLAEHELTDEERQALVEPDIGLVYVRGVRCARRWRGRSTAWATTFVRPDPMC